MKMSRDILRIFAIVGCLAAVTAVGAAQSFDIKPAGTPFPLKNIGKKGELTPNKTIEPSAVEPIGDGKYLIVGDDKDNGVGQSLAVVETASGLVIKLLENIQGKAANPKWEAMAKDDEGNFYIMGSHNEDDAEKLVSKSRLFRFRLKNENETEPNNFKIDMDSVRELDIKESLKALGLYSSDPAKNQTKIEGLAVRTNAGHAELAFGFREPFFSGDRVGVFVAEVPATLGAWPTITKLTLRPFFGFIAGKPQDSPVPFKISSIEYCKQIGGFLLLTSTEDKQNKFHGNALWYVSDEMILKAQTATGKGEQYVVKALNLLEFEPNNKAEGLSIQPAKIGGKTTIVIMYDNDPKNAPPNISMMQLMELSPRP
ncbi:MAG: hypothetical protein ACKVQJ_00430 [Pyrinomonadaceae bacterium]